MRFEKTQNLNSWVDMLHHVYGRTQNYAKSEHEICSHLAEVCGAFGKYLLKKRDATRAEEFLPKMFAWAVALLKKVKGDSADLEEIILVKFPRVCPYCTGRPCQCWRGDKPHINETQLLQRYHRDSLSQKRSIDDFQLMFRGIYEESWAVKDATSPEQVYSVLGRLFSRLVEEVSEVAEAIRFFHLYPSNFDNELADYFAWWFALASSLHHAKTAGREMTMTSELLWKAYPGSCPVCELDMCDCRPGPVRELLSKPALNDLGAIDALTQAANRAAYEEDRNQISTGSKLLATPAVCVRIDVDYFKRVNDEYDHDVGDEALKHLVTVMRQKLRPRDRLYRVGGDEFALLCPDLSPLEAQGMLSRVARALKAKPLVARRFPDKPLVITLSVGIAECNASGQIKEAFQLADEAAIESKKAGRDKISVYKPNDASTQ
ncbi:MAG TPA: diguanylate cyclase [Archangium sp.]|nr:diguanylate cyclase [Archangium sp.]